MTKQINWPKVILFGDSITQFSFSKEGCWGSIVSDYFQRKVDVLNRGFSGYNTRMCLNLLPYIDNDLKDVSAVTVFLGANDASTVEDTPTQGVPLKEYSNNLALLVRHFKNKGVKNIILITPPVFNPPEWKEYCRVNDKPYNDQKSKELTATYANACVELAKLENVSSVDLHSEMLKHENWQKFLIDGLHLSKQGSELLAGILLPVLDKQIAADLHCILPDWKDSLEDSEQSFKQWANENICMFKD